MGTPAGSIHEFQNKPPKMDFENRLSKVALPLRYQTLTGNWSRERPDARALYEALYRARGERENRIKSSCRCLWTG